MLKYNYQKKWFSWNLLTMWHQDKDQLQSTHHFQESQYKHCSHLTFRNYQLQRVYQHIEQAVQSYDYNLLMGRH